MLHTKILDMISSSRWNSIPLDCFIEIVSTHYYEQKDNFLSDDFITAPEISQMFGEIIGVYCAHTWNLYGNNRPVTLMEVGGGSGTLMCDLLRGVDHIRSFSDSIDKVYMLERSSHMRSLQRVNSQQYLQKYDFEWGFYY